MLYSNEEYALEAKAKALAYLEAKAKPHIPIRQTLLCENNLL
jgi:hypothetical protein